MVASVENRRARVCALSLLKKFGVARRLNRDVIEAGVVRDLLGWGAPSGLSAAERGLALLGRLEVICAGRLVL